VIGWTYLLGCVRSHLYQSCQTMPSFVKDWYTYVFAQGNIATLMKGNRNIEQRGPLGKTLPRKTTTTLPVVAQQRCPFWINIYYHKSDGYYYLSTHGNVHHFQKGLICSHHHHERQTVVFSSRNDMDEHMEKMVKQFAMTNSSPSTCVWMLHRMDDCLYDVQNVVNIFDKAKKSLLEEKGCDTSSTKAQQIVNYIMTNPDTNAVIVIYDPSSAHIGGRQKGRPNKKRENHLVLLMKMSNKEASVEELVFDREYTVDDYAQARRHALHLPDSDAMLLYVSWCTNEELWMATVFGYFWTLDNTPMTNIEDRPLMIMTVMFTYRKSCPYGRAILPSEGKWVFDFSMVVELPLLYGNNVIRNIQQVTTNGDYQIYNPLDLLSQNESSPWYRVKHIMLCTFNLFEQQFNNDVLNKKDREGIVDQVKNWIRSFTSYCESEDEYKLSYKLLIEFIYKPDTFESMGPSYPYILDTYLLSTCIKKKDKLLF
jgi:hypothetical protein